MENINIPHSAPKQSASIQKLNESIVSRAFAFFPWAQNIKHSSENSNLFSDHVIEVSVTFQFEGSKQHSIPHEKELCVQNDINAYKYFITIQSFMTTATTMIAQFITSLAHIYTFQHFHIKQRTGILIM